MNSAAIGFLCCLLVLSAQGQLDNRSKKCKCSNGFIGRISAQHIKSVPIIHQKSIFCPHIEIIITVTGNKQKCVNPESPFGKYVLETKQKRESREAERRSTTNSQKHPRSSKGRTTDSAPKST